MPGRAWHCSTSFWKVSTRTRPARRRRNNLGWLVGPTIASFVAAFIVVKLFDHIFAGATSGVVSIARPGLFVLTWTAVTVQSGMHGVAKRVRRLRQGNTKAIKALAKGEKP